jgi:hypothetical protein
MKHTRTITVARAETKQFDDPLGAAFFQVWLTVFTWIITMGVSEK